jgi:hypothetical protein
LKAIKLYFAGGVYPQSLENRLVSYIFKDQLRNWFKVTGTVPGNIILDSGAFSAWKSGKVIDLREFITYAHKAISDGLKLNKVVRVVNLDVIPGKVGETKQLNKFISGQRAANLEVINKAARDGYKNMMTMIEEGITPIHVFHQGEEWKWLDRMVERVPYIGISPANDMPVDSKRKWMHSVFSYLHKNNIEVDTHGFAVFDQKIVEEFPWTSCDATTPIMRASFGNVVCPAGGFLNPDYSRKPFAIAISERKSIDGINVSDMKLKKLLGKEYSFKSLQDYYTRLDLNIRYILEYEQYVNEKKKSTEFDPIKNQNFFV